MPFFASLIRGRLLSVFVLGALSLVFSGSVFAGLMNADFSSGFDNWNGELVDTFGPLPVDPATEGDFYSIIPNGARLTTSDVNPDVFVVSLFQDFTVDSIASGSTLELSLSVSAAADDAFAQLRDLDGILPTVDLLGGGTFDITAWAGANATLEFSVSDVFFDFPDELEVSNIAFTEIPRADVPAPAPLALLAIACVVFARRLQRA